MSNYINKTERNEKTKKNSNMLNFKILSIMKARLLKFLFTMVAVLAVTNGFSQIYQPYSQMSDSSGMGITDTVTVSGDSAKMLPYYVRPDNVLNDMTGDYVPGTQPSDQGIYSNFSWTYKSVSGNATINYENGAAADTVPYVEVEFTTTTSGDPDTLYVEETSAGGCTGDTVNLPIYIVDEPSFNVTGNGTDSIGYEVCAKGPTPIEINSLTDNGVTGGDLRFRVDSITDQLNPDLSSAGELQSTSFYQNVHEDSLGVPNTDIFQHNLGVQNGEITQYTFKIYGMSDHISRKSDYLSLSDKTGGTNSQYTYYPPTNGPGGTTGDNASKIVYIVYPTPQTGDIYYIPNSFDQ
jgi:hypothetical protein